MHKQIPPSYDDFSIYDTQYCPDCGKVILSALDDSSKRREFAGHKHICGDLGKALHQTYPSDLGVRSKDDLRK